MPRVTTLAAAIALLSIGQPAKANFQTGNQLKQRCSEKGFDEASCMGYMLGVFDTLLDMNAVCLPSGVIAGQIYEVGRQFMARNPQLLHETAPNILARAFVEAFPCKGVAK